MGDIEMVRLCAEAMGIRLPESDPVSLAFTGGKVRTPLGWEAYDPLHDDAQAMALVEKFRLTLSYNDFMEMWRAQHYSNGKRDTDSFAPDINRAIVDCVATMHARKS